MTQLYGPTQSKARYPLPPQVGRFPSGRNSVLLPLLTALLVFCLSSAHAAIKNAASVSQADVAAAIASAADGDTVKIPAGSATWTTAGGLNIVKAITLQGAGAGITIITNGLAANESRFISVGLVANKTSRITGIEFKETVQHQNPCLQLFGRNTNNSRVRVDHCKFNGLRCFSITVNTALGVIDNNVFLPAGNGIPIYFFGAIWNETGTAQGMGYGSMADSNHFGTSQFMFVEDNVFTYQGGPYAASDSNTGARYVFRYNTVNNGWVEAHQGGGGFVGTRAAEIYNNTFINPNTPLIANIRSGVFLIHDNTSTYASGSPVIQLADYAVSGDSYFGISNGKNPWDVNMTGAPFYSGTTTGGGTSGTVGTVTVSGNPWTANQWQRYSVVKTSAVTNMGSAAEIVSNTTNTITFARKGAYGVPDLQFTAGGGETFEINKVIHSFDMPGRSGGSLVTGVPATVRPPGWNNQITDPCYEWNNTYNSGSGNINFTVESGILRNNEHYFNDTEKPGYTPYTYPHPLRSQPLNVRVP